VQHEKEKLESNRKFTRQVAFGMIVVSIGVTAYRFFMGNLELWVAPQRWYTLVLSCIAGFNLIYFVISLRMAPLPAGLHSRIRVIIFIIQVIVVVNALTMLDMVNAGHVYVYLFALVLLAWLYRATAIQFAVLFGLMALGPILIVTPIFDFGIPAKARQDLGILVAVAALAGWALATTLEQTRLRVLIHRKTIERQNRLLKNLSEKDELTGLYNRRVMLRALEGEQERSKRYETDSYFVLFDVDGFKKINDTLGHSVGDDVLKRIADIFTGCSRDSDTVARFGGEEIAILLPNAGLDGAKRVAERIREMVAANTFPGVPWQVTVSAGGASLLASEKAPVTTESVDELKEPFLALADRKLYEAKAAGRNIVLI